MPIATHNSVALASIRKQHQNISDGTQRLADTFQPTYSSHNGWAFAGAAFSGNHLWFTGESREALLSKVIALNVHVAVIYLNEY